VLRALRRAPELTLTVWSLPFFTNQESLLELTLDTPLRAPLSPTLSATAACSAAEGDATLRVTRLSLAASPTARTRLRLALRGAAGADAAPTLNPAHGRALTALGRGGSVLYRRLNGGAACSASTDVPTPAGALTLSLAAFLTPPRHGGAQRGGAADSDDEEGGSSGSSSSGGDAASDCDAGACGRRVTALAQATLRPAPRVALALTATRSALTPWPRRWRSGSSDDGDADAAASALTAAAAQALAHAHDDALVSAARTCIASMPAQRRADAGRADVTTSLGAAFAAVLHDTVTATFWAAADVGRSGSRAEGGGGAAVEWAAALAPAPHAPGLRWGLVAGRPLASRAPQAEAFLHCGGTGGWTVTPGVLAVRGAGLAALVRAHASF
jgi:hypothetical protein